ncbi:MAG: dCMP deaminase family protein [candidate division NC10 bacterium]|nr:dCMP deaminase family protein [candidate division NC10 bacterium]
MAKPSRRRAPEVAPPISGRPVPDDYFMGIAYAVRERANCRGYKVGAILILDGRIVSTGYNGTPENMPNCDEGGCVRCAERVQSSSGKPKFKSGTGYDICICVHAEQNALLAAARFGIPVAGGMIYSTLQPCFGCLKEMAQARIHGIRFRHPWSHPDQSLKPQYDVLKNRFEKGVKQIFTPDPREAWALGRGPRPSDTGHPIQTR